eukprot:746409-Hanusia_phi.AAC.1
MEKDTKVAYATIDVPSKGEYDDDDDDGKEITIDQALSSINGWGRFQVKSNTQSWLRRVQVLKWAGGGEEGDASWEGGENEAEMSMIAR